MKLFSTLLLASLSCMLTTDCYGIEVQNLNDSGRGSLRAAIDAAAPNEVITFRSSLDGQTISLTSGGFSITQALSIDATSLPNRITIISPPRQRIISASNIASGSLILRNINFNESSDSNSGSGIEALSADLEITDCRFEDNDATDGGAIFAQESQLTLTNVVFSDNGPSDSGGAIFLEEADDSSFRNCQFSNNRSPGGAGGAVYSTQSYSLSFEGCSFDNNASFRGGAVRYIFSSGTFDDCSFTSNSASGDGGGFSANFSTPSFNNCRFVDNSGENGGGARVFGGSSSIPFFDQCLFDNNSATRAGGGLLYDSSRELRNCVFSNNSSVQDGGGLNINTASNSVILTNCSFRNNYSQSRGGGLSHGREGLRCRNCSWQGNRAEGSGGAIHLVSNAAGRARIIEMINCIIWNNSANGSTTQSESSLSSINSDIIPSSYSNSLIEHWSDGGVNDLGGNDNLDGTLSQNNPLFIHSADPFSAPVGESDLRLQTSSPALNRGDGPMGESINRAPTDAAGNARFEGVIDLGAFEGNVDARFSLLHPNLVPDQDNNNNGLTNYTDYALGADPTAPHNATVQASLANNQLTFSFRNNASDVFVEFQKSQTLLSDDWDAMIAGTDFTVGSESISGSTTTQILNLLTTAPSLFFREAFTETLLNP